MSKKLFILEMNHSQPLNARRHSELQKKISLPWELETTPVSQPCLLLGTGKDIETRNHPSPSPYISGRLFLGSQDCVAACLTLWKNNSTKEGLPGTTEIACSFSGDSSSQIPAWQKQVQRYQLLYYIRAGISPFWSELPNCHGCSSEQLSSYCKEFRGKKHRSVHTSQKESISQLISS